MENLVLVVFAFLLVLLNGFFVAAEFSLVKLRQTRVEAIARAHGWRGGLLAKVRERLDAYLSACQLGITLSSLGLGWIGEPAFARLLEPVLAVLGVDSPQLVHGIAFFFAFFTISFLHIVVGELAPKSMAIRYPEPVGLWTAAPLYLFYWVMYPAIWVLNASANTLLRWLGLTEGSSADSRYSADELKLILRSGVSGGQYTSAEWNIMAHSLDFGELEVADLMRPINEVVALYHGKSLAENLATIARHRYSRYPYFDETGETVLGVIHLKDLFLAEHSGRQLSDLRDYLRPIQYVSSLMSAQELFRQFRKGMPHFAMVGRRKAKPMGFVTLDNLLGAMVGEIRDEFLQGQNDWAQQPDGSLVGKGSLPIFSLERSLGVDIELDDDVASVGGLIMAKLDGLPEEGQQVVFDRFEVTVLKMEGPRIALVKVTPREPDTTDEAS